MPAQTPLLYSAGAHCRLGGLCGNTPITISIDGTRTVLTIFRRLIIAQRSIIIESGSSEPQTYRPCPAQGVAPMWFPIPSSNDHILSSILLSQTNEGKLGMQMRGRLKLNRNGEDKTHAEAKPQAKTDPCACFG